MVTPRRTQDTESGAAAGTGSADRIKDKQILSLYALCGRESNRHSLQEIRVIYESDGKTLLTRAKAEAELRDTALVNVAQQPVLREEFEKESLGDTAVDFGQLLLLFQKPDFQKYRFAMSSPEMIGADRTLVISFAQQSGSAALHLNEAGKRSETRLAGEIWVREADYLPVRIVLRAERSRKKVQIRDEVRVDYELHQGNVLLPASVAHRRYLDDKLRAENVYQYGDWQPLEAR